MADERATTSPASFVWPPRNAPEPSAPERALALPVAKTPRTPTALVTLRGLERAWMAPTALPLSRRMEALGWTPDDVSQYCARCGGDVGPLECDEFGCAACRNRRWPWSRFVRLGRYDGALREWIHEVKFTRWRRLGEDLGRELGIAVQRQGFHPLPDERWLVVPTPTPFARRVARGLDHARSIASGAARELGVPMRPLMAARPHASQRSTPASQRARNVSGVFRLRRPHLAKGAHVLLVDDVRTTGATLRACGRALRQGGAAGVWAACLAVTPQPGRGAADERSEPLDGVP